MPHQCVRCNTFYDDGAQEILSGCNCGSKLFFFVKKHHLEKAKEENLKLSKNEKEEIEKDVFELIGVDRDIDKPVILDLESIKILKPGKYELDIVRLFKDNPLVYRLAEGKYVIDIPESLKKALKDRSLKS